MNARRIGVVGAGPAGLAAAHALTRAGARVCVIESGGAVGGRSCTVEIEGYRIDPATQLFGSMYRSLLRVLEEAGGGALALRSPGRDALVRGGRVHEIVYGDVGSMLSSGAVPWATKLRLGASYLPFLTRHADVLDLHSLDRAAAAGLDRRSIAEWGRSEMGSDFVRYLVEPLLATGYGLDPEETGAAFYHALARHGTSLEVFALRGGAGGFCERVAASIADAGAEIRLSTRVDSVEPEAGGVRLGGSAWSERFDGVVLATPAPVARALVPDEGARVRLGRVRTRSSISVALLLDRPVGVRYFGLSFPRDESRRLAAACVEENKSPGLVPAGRGLLLLFPTVATGERLVDGSLDDALDALLPDLARVLPGVERGIRRAELFRWPDGRLTIPPGYVSAIPEIERLDVSSLVLAGEYLHSPTVEGAVVSGLRAARRLGEAIGTAA